MNQRIVFGRPLSSQAVVRSKLANMIARVESSQAWLENVTHQMNNVRGGTAVAPHPARTDVTSGQMSYNEQSDKLAGQIGLLKQYVF